MVVKGSQFWRHVAFSDESSFTLDGPDGLLAHWSESRRPGRWHYTRRNGGGSMMVWGCFSFNEMPELAFIEENINSSRYCAVLKKTNFPFLERLHSCGAILQQGNAPAHTSAYTMEFFGAIDVEVLPWPARSPDVNPIESVWGLLAQRVYHNGKQYDTIEDLKESLSLAWDAIDVCVFHSLISSISHRLISII